MKVTFVYPDMLALVPDYRGAYYGGIASMSAVLKQSGHKTALVHVHDAAMDREGFLSAIDDTAPDLIAFSSTTNTFPFVAKAAGWLEESGRDRPTIAGGVHAILNPMEVLDTPGIDLVCLGEGEDVLLEVCEALSLGRGLDGIAGLGWRDGGAKRLNGLGRRTESLDDLPLPDREIFDYPRLYNERTGAAMIMASRGCPYDCTYCCNEAIRHALGNLNPAARFHSVDYVIREAQAILDHFDFITELRFDDDILFLNTTWAEEFAARFPVEVGLPFVCNLRPNLAREKTVALLAQAGCREVRIGLESGNDAIRNEILGRRLSRERIIDSIATCHRHGLRVMTFNMVGLPYETPRTVVDTIRLNADATADEMQHTIFCPYPGTRLHEQCKQSGFLTERTSYDFFTDTTIDQPTISRRQVLMFQRWFPQLVRTFRVLGRLPAGLARPLSGAMTALLTSSVGNIVADLTLRVVHPLYAIPKMFLVGKPRARADSEAPTA